jgi:hypothetical protein
MSAGSPIVPVRINQLLLTNIDNEIRRLNQARKEAPYTRTSFILTAIRDKLSHLHRSRKEGKLKAEAKKIKKRFDKDNEMLKNQPPWTEPHSQEWSTTPPKSS